MTLLKFLLLSLLVFNFTFAQNLYGRNRSENETCRKISQQLFERKTAKTKKQQDYLIYEVGRLQLLLNKLGYFGEKPDYGENFDISYFDKSTVAAVRKYQEKNLPWTKDNGRVGFETLNFINKYEFCNSDRRFAELIFDKTFTLPSSGFSFKYPALEFKYSPEVTNSEVGKLTTYLDICNVDEYADKNLMKRTLCYRQSRDGAFMGASLIANILKDKIAKEECLKKDPKAIKEDEDFNPKVMMNGHEFFNFRMLKKEVGHELHGDIFRIFKNKKCYEFKLNTEISRLGAAEIDEELGASLDAAVGKMRASLETIEFIK